METKPMEQAYATTRRVLENVSPDQISNPTPCASWNVGEVINHMIGGAKLATSTVESGSWADDGSTAPDFSAGDYLAAFDQGFEDLKKAFGKPDADGKTLALPFGPMPAEAFFGIVTSDMFVHGWDLAKATGQPTDLDPAFAQTLLEQSKANIQDAFRGPDGKAPFGPEQQAPDGASVADQLAAFLGRTV